jgi:hypothetical protein
MKLFHKKIFQKPSYRILLGILGVALLISLYFRHLFVFPLMTATIVLPIRAPFLLFSKSISLYEMAAFANFVLLGLCYVAWRKRRHAWWVEVLCVLAFYLVMAAAIFSMGSMT